MPKINPGENLKKIKKFSVCGILGKSKGLAKSEKCVQSVEFRLKSARQQGLTVEGVES